MITVLYAIVSFATFVALVCMLTSCLLNSQKLFKFFLFLLAAGCLASTVSPFLHGYEVGWWTLGKAVGLMGMLVMMRLRQMEKERTSFCARPAWLMALWSRVTAR